MCAYDYLVEWECLLPHVSDQGVTRLNERVCYHMFLIREWPGWMRGFVTTCFWWGSDQVEWEGLLPHVSDQSILGKTTRVFIYAHNRKEAHWTLYSWKLVTMQLLKDRSNVYLHLQAIIRAAEFCTYCSLLMRHIKKTNE